ncbi:CLUMA_CG002329, isoform A [Clunio marinus]|uniref:CLUMA_CG002329, isoform A n=1 Tax=Clunio marinus TaxID=568069 RepID=A0A1J1HMD1_9DIPT|nr:CLUMA_CG002329, isoform A [Clunio marinus]
MEKEKQGKDQKVEVERSGFCLTLASDSNKDNQFQAMDCNSLRKAKAQIHFISSRTCIFNIPNFLLLRDNRQRMKVQVVS